MIKNTTATKVTSAFSPHGRMGEKYLAAGVHVGMRLWEEQPHDLDATRPRDYETVGYVVTGRAELHLEGQLLLLEPGDSWVVPRGAAHAYRVLEPFVAVEATCPPAFVRGRDEPRGAGQPLTRNEAAEGQGYDEEILGS